MRILHGAIATSVRRLTDADQRTYSLQPLVMLHLLWRVRENHTTKLDQQVL